MQKSLKQYVYICDQDFNMVFMIWVIKDECIAKLIHGAVIQCNIKQ